MKSKTIFFFVLFLLGFFQESFAQNWIQDTPSRIRTNRRVGIHPPFVGPIQYVVHPDPSVKLAVGGNAVTEEIRIQVDASWPDYVFLPDYQLMPLEQVRTYIQDSGHLPGFPSQESVEEETPALGEVHRKLLEKCEELTLYLFESHERKAAIERRIAALEEELGL